MHIRFTSVATEEVGPILGNVGVQIQDALNPFFAEKSFGSIDQFIAVIVAVDSDVAENNRFAKGHNKIGSYKNLLTNERIKYISFALPLDPLAVELMNEEKVRQKVCSALLKRLESPDLKFQKSFDYNRFSEELRLAIKIYSLAIH